MNCAKLIKNLNVQFELMKKNPNPREVQECLRLNAITMKLLYRRLKDPATEHCEKLKIQPSISVLKSLETKMKNLLKTGAGTQQRNNRRDRVQWKEIASVFKSRLRTASVVNLVHKDLNSFFHDAKKCLIPKIKNALKKHFALKVNSILFCEFQITEPDSEITRDIKNFPTKSKPILQSTDLDEWFYVNVVDDIKSKIENEQFQRSGWSMTEIINIIFNINQYQPLVGGTYTSLPNHIQNKKAVINIQNTDDFCFLWCIMAALHPAQGNKNVSRTSSYPHFQDHLKYDNLEFPMRLKSVKKFEEMNKLSINVYALEGKEVYPVYLTSLNSENPVIHLLMIPVESEHNEDSDTDEDENVYHFCLIKNLSRIVSKNLSKHDGQVYICDRCLNHFVLEDSFLRHKEDCFQVKKQCKMNFPSEEKNILSFKNYSNKEFVPYVVYADLECLLVDSKQDDLGYQKHIPYSIGYHINCSYDDSLSKFDMNRGKDCIKWFIERLCDLAKFYDQQLKNPIPMKMTNEDHKTFYTAKVCHICEKPFTPYDTKCRDHCHLTGKFRGASHNKCNLNFQNKKYIPCVFHNMSGYDSHFIIKAIANCYPGQVKLLPVNKETYISSIKEFDGMNVCIRFIDSFRFMASSIEKLASYLTVDDKRITRSFYQNDEQFNLVTQKGVCPYDYCNSWEKLDDTHLPTKEDFYSKLNNQNISDDEYLHAQSIWTSFGVETLGEYLDIYLKTDVLLLADIFQNFRKTCHKIYNLDPLHYCTAPGLSFDAMLKHTAVKLELFTCSEMYHFVEKGLRGGVAVCSGRYAEANNKYMGNLYDATKPSSYLLYLDVNNLYGYSMSSYLPYEGFKWISPEEFDINTPNDSDTGYILEVDFEYPKELFELHSDFPLAPEHLTPPGSKNSKLMTTFYDKKNYVIHYVNLKQYVELGLKLTKIHRVLKFNQAPWLKSYIELNTNLRQKSTNEFEKNFFKLMNNSIFGKCCQNVRRYRDVRIINKFEGRYGARALISKPNFHSATIIDDEFTIIEMEKTSLMFNKPIYVGFSILDLSKTVMYDFFFNYIKKTFGDAASLKYTDTDSMVLQFYVEDIYEYILKDIDKFDTSGFSPDNPYNIPLTNRCVLGLMKDEMNGRVMTHFIGLRAKMYAYLMYCIERECKRLKGIKQSALRDITFKDYFNCLFHKEKKCVEQNLITNKKHNVYTIKQRKLALSYDDDKRVILRDLITTVPWGFNSLNK